MKTTPLTEVHKSLGAKMVDFHGWEMPVQYSGVIDEHLCVRKSVGIFDLTHMGELLLTGKDSLKTISHLVSNDPSLLEPGKIQYSPITNESGGIVDDILIYRVPEGFFLVVNASNLDKDFAWIKDHLIGDTQIRNLSDEVALIAVQGVNSQPVVEKALGISLGEVEYYSFVDHCFQGKCVRISRTGYTGEDGFELYLPNALAEDVWALLMEKGEPFGIKPVGLGARDTLRLEMRMPLYGNDIDDTTTPLEAGLGRFTVLDKGDFVGKAILERQKTEGISRKLIAFVVEGRGIPRQDYQLANEEGEIIGRVTSGTQSPSLNKPIGMGYVQTDFAKPGTPIQVIIRNKPVEAVIIKGRFVSVQKPN